MTDPALLARLAQATALLESGQALQAELTFAQVLERVPGQPQAALGAAELAARRGDHARAAAVLQDAHHHDPAHVEVAFQLASALAALGATAEATQPLERALAHDAEQPLLWLLLGHLREARRDPHGALRAWMQALPRAQRAGQWLDAATTPPELVRPVSVAAERLRRGRRELLFASYDDLRQRHGSAELRRMDQALGAHLKEWDARPAHPRQQPRFFYFPGLSDTPYHDPFKQAWAGRLRDAFPEIRAEALHVLGQSQPLPDFLRLGPRDRPEQFLGGQAARPTWQAHFFYRRGKRYDDNHAACPATSALLESIELCRIDAQAPEICFSVLRPQTHIKPHHGVTNTRLVMHLPLIVPAGCALNLVDVGEHAWREGEPVMFDDTYLHEAWNRSDTVRVVLLMDCWNPELSPVERQAVKQFVETVAALSPGASPLDDGAA